MATQGCTECSKHLLLLQGIINCSKAPIAVLGTCMSFFEPINHVTDANRILLECNQLCIDMFKRLYCAQLSVGQHFGECIEGAPETDYVKIMKLWDRAFQEGE